MDVSWLEDTNSVVCTECLKVFAVTKAGDSHKHKCCQALRQQNKGDSMCASPQAEVHNAAATGNFLLAAAPPAAEQQQGCATLYANRFIPPEAWDAFGEVTAGCAEQLNPIIAAPSQEVHFLPEQPGVSSNNYPATLSWTTVTPNVEVS